MSMSQGEKLIWAAVFARECSLHNPPPHVLRPGKEQAWEDWELDQFVTAAEIAGGAIEYLREKVPARVLEGFGQESSTYKMLMEMVI